MCVLFLGLATLYVCTNEGGSQVTYTHIGWKFSNKLLNRKLGTQHITFLLRVSGEESVVLPLLPSTGRGPVLQQGVVA